MKLIPFLLCILLITPTLAHEREHGAVSVHALDEEHLSASFATAWESRYYVEGRDALDGDSILAQTMELRWQAMSFGVWYGNSSEQHYDELHTALLYHFELASDFEAYFGYNHVRFPHGDGHHDHEIHSGISWNGLPHEVELALDAYHSFGADGFFAEASASRAWELTDSLSADVTAILGMNQGYVADGHDGANHTALSLGLTYVLSESWTLNAHGTYSWAIDRKAGAADGASLKDFFHAGVGVEWSF